MINNLVTPSDLTGFPGAPFSNEQVDAAALLLRNILGWHVAPVVTETVTVDSRGGRYLFLPSLRVSSVTEVRDVTGDTPVVLTGWFKTGPATLVRDQGWPCRESAVEVDMVHGYTQCPADLLSAVAEMCQQLSRNPNLIGLRIDDYSESYRPSGDPSEVPDASSLISPAALYYRVPRRSR